MWQDRCFKVFLMCILLAIPAGIFKPESPDRNQLGEISSEAFWTLKTHCPPEYDMVLVGDSRMYRDVSPKAMQTVLTEYRILNFGYSSGGLNPTMYRAAEQKLDPESNKKSIVLGISPHAFTLAAADNAHFLQERDRPKEFIYKKMREMNHEEDFIDHCVNFLAPTTPRDIMKALFGIDIRLPDGSYHEYHKDGWVASWAIPEDPTKGVKSFRHKFQKGKVSPELVTQLIQQTRSWNEQGIPVFAFRPPTTEEMVAVENELGGFDEESFVRRFEEVGGIWFDLDPERYHSYDGSHLRRDSAIQLSIDLARLIKEYCTIHWENT